MSDYSRFILDENTVLNPYTKKKEKITNPLYLLHRDFKVSYADIASLFGYKKGYVYLYTAPFRARCDVPAPLARMCDAMRTIFKLKKELEKYESLKALLRDIGDLNSQNDLNSFDDLFKNK